MARDRSARPEAKPLRLFVAVDVPDAVRGALAEAVEPVRGLIAGARWVPERNWHVTLKFLGRTWPRLQPWVEERVAEVASAHPAIRTHLTGLGAFPSPRRARVLWTGLADPGGRFPALVTSLEERLADEFRVGSRPFTPHLTIARIDPPAALPEEALAVEVPGEEFTVSELVVYRSRLQRPAPVYEPLARVPLSGPG